MTQPYMKSFEAEVLERLGRIETHAELAAQSAAVTALDHESRVRVIEKRQWYAAGVAGVVAFVAPLLSHLNLSSLLK